MSKSGQQNGMQDRVEQLTDAGLGQNEIARQLGINPSTVSTHRHRIRRKRAAQALCPVDTPGLETTHGTVQYKRMEDGTIIPVNWWARQRPEQIRIIEGIVEGLCLRVEGQGKVKTRKPRKSDSGNILAELDIFDPHVGMYAAERYTREANFDCTIAAAEMVKAAEYIAGRFNKPGEVVVVFGGDILHTDSRNNRTEKSGNMLDVDTRYQRVVEYAIKACTEVVEIAGSVAPKVRIVITPGNHDWHSCIWLSRVLQAYYSRSRSVVIDIQQSPRKSYVWGKNLLVWTHGDGVKPAKWPSIIAAEFPKEWGKTTRRYLKMGHFHHKKTIAPVVVDEQPGLDVEYLAALCPTDSWHAEAGYVGTQRGANGFEYHKKGGRITRFDYNSEL